MERKRIKHDLVQGRPTSRNNFAGWRIDDATEKKSEATLALAEELNHKPVRQERLKSVSIWEVLLNVLPKYLEFNF